MEYNSAQYFALQNEKKNETAQIYAYTPGLLVLKESQSNPGQPGQPCTPGVQGWPTTINNNNNARRADAVGYSHTKIDLKFKAVC